jgi:hypothetical protein
MTKAGKPCTNRRMAGSELCFSHSDDAVAYRKRATQASAEKRRARVEARKDASEASKLSLTERIRRDAARRADEVAKSLVDAAVADGSSRAMAELLNRVEGKVIDRLETTAGNPSEMSEAELEAIVLKWATEPMTEGSTIDASSDSPSAEGPGHTERPETDDSKPV